MHTFQRGRGDVSVDDEPHATQTALSPEETAILNFETDWRKHTESKTVAIRESFCISTTRYYQVLNALIDRPEALQAAPLTVKRLLRIRTRRRQQRTTLRGSNPEAP